MQSQNERPTSLGARVCALIALAAAVLLASLIAIRSSTGPSDNRAGGADGTPNLRTAAGGESGLLLNDPRAFQGYTLIAPMTSKQTHLIDMQGRIVQSWESQYAPAHGAYLLENGHLLRTCDLGSETRAFGASTGAGGQVQEFTWDGQLVWDFRFFNDKQLPHHDVAKLPNGNVLMIVWDKKSAQEALAAGRRPDRVGTSFLLPDSLVEVKPTGKTTGEIVWEWHVWDHLIQDFDKTKPNFGNVADHPELVNVNYGEDVLAPVRASKDGMDKLRSIGYLGTGAPASTAPHANPDWTHFNAVAYNSDLDQIVVTVHSFSEFWIIDHGTTTAEAVGHTGGKRGKGGDILYRWGNPRADNGGTRADRRLFAPHDAHWIPSGLPGEGHVLVFNNGMGRPGGNHSSVDEIVLPVNAKGLYDCQPSAPFGPEEPVWSYTAPRKSDFYSILVSGAQRLGNGNTLICSGANGVVFEVNEAKEVVWQYAHAVASESRPMLPDDVAAGGLDEELESATLGLTSSVEESLGLNPQQKEQVRALQREVRAKLEKMLKAEQRAQLDEGSEIDSHRDQPPGQVIAPSAEKPLKLSAEQKSELGRLQGEVDLRIGQILTEEQRQRIKHLRASWSPYAHATSPLRAGLRGLGRNSLFRAYRYAPDYPGITGKQLTLARGAK